jgi:superfamily II DNA/RNA helicase
LDDDYFEDPEPFDESASFYSMKLSRPLLKAIENAKYSHPTPIQV